MGGLDPKTAIREILEHTMTRMLTQTNGHGNLPNQMMKKNQSLSWDNCTPLRSPVTIANWKDSKSRRDLKVEIPATRIGNFNVNRGWVKRSSCRLEGKKNDKASNIAPNNALNMAPNKASTPNQ
ncbi:hypothetical protein QAD02_001961 [Eretmocerus hayati]|uniref:Uncharacterized protein n=1 Tax=Eretmocerus hayati TaxID=131215 RepID=A0ACC2NHX6_9HYME|nr:hypothetical protein QAD02_001961 [Eretmocerus hayati]